MRLLVTLLSLIFVSSVCAEGTEVSFEATDGLTIYGDVYAAEGTPKSAPLILLFHQGGGDARGEYTPLASRLTAQGYNLLAIDQRSGGNRFDGVNRTLAGINNEETSYCDAYPDLEAALKFALEYGFTGKIAAWYYRAASFLFTVTFAS